MTRRPNTVVPLKLKLFNWIIVLLLLAPEAALAAGYVPNAPNAPDVQGVSAWETLERQLATTDVQESALIDVPVEVGGRLLFAPAIDSDGDPVTNPTMRQAAPVIELLDEKGGMVALAAQLLPDDPDFAPVGFPVVFRIWTEDGFEVTRTGRSDAWGAASAQVTLRDISQVYYYQASASAYGETEVRQFRFNPDEVSYKLHADGAQMWHYQQGSRLVFTVNSPRPLVEGRDLVMLTLARRPQEGLDIADLASSPEINVSPMLDVLNSNGAGVPFPDLPMQIIDEYTAQIEVKLPKGYYGAIASVAIEGEPAEQFYSEAAVFEVETDAPTPDAQAIWESALEYENGRKLVKYHTPPGQAHFALFDSQSVPQITDVWMENSKFLRAWRTGPFSWQEEEYDINMDLVVDDGKKEVSLAGFDYDPMLRRYTIAIKTHLDEPITDTLRIDVYGPGGLVIKHEDRQVVLEPDEVFYYQIEVPAELGEPQGLRVILDDPIEAIINAVRAASRELLHVIRYHGTYSMTLKLAADAVGITILEVKLVISTPPTKVEPSAQWFPNGSSELALLNDVKNYVLGGAWDFDNAHLDIGGATLSDTISLGLNFDIDQGQCPDEDSKKTMETALASMAESMNAGLQALGATLSFDDTAEAGGISIPLFWFLSLFGQFPVPGFTGSIGASGLTLSFSVDFSVSIGLRLVFDLFPWSWFDPVGAKAQIERLYSIVMFIQGLVAFTVEARTIVNAQLEQADCTPNQPDSKPPDDRQDVYQGLERFYTADTYQETLSRLNQWIEAAEASGFDRAKRYFDLEMAQTELDAFSHDYQPFSDYIDQTMAIMQTADTEMQGIANGTIPISATTTITEAIFARGQLAYNEIEDLPYPTQQRLLLDNVQVAEMYYLALQGEELELQRELQELLFQDSIGVVTAGFTDSTVAALQQAGLPYQFISLWPGNGGQYNGRPAPYIAPDLAPRALVVPSGGLHGIANSPEATAWLEAYVAGGGLLIVFTQAFGTDWQALPGGEVRGVGYNEDQRCQQASVRAGMPSDWLIWMGTDYPDIQVDGAFTAWPSNANLLLLRTWGNFPNYPAMIEYTYGSGSVLATSAYGDWATSTGITWGDDWNMTRTLLQRAYLLSRGQDIGDVTQIGPNTWYTQTVSITNNQSFTLTDALVQIPVQLGRAKYTGHTMTTTIDVAPGLSDTFDIMLRTPTVGRNIHDWTRIGLYRLRAHLSGGEDWQQFTHWGPFLHVTGSVPAPDITVMLTADKVAVNPFESVVVTATVRNFSAVPRDVSLLPVDALAGQGSFSAVVPAGGTAVHTYTLSNVSQRLEPAVQMQDNTNLDILEEARMIIHLTTASAQLTTTLPDTIGAGTPLDIQILNQPRYKWQTAVKIVSGTVELTLYAPDNSLLWDKSQPLPTMGPGAVYTASFTADSLAPITIGNYRLEFKAFDDRGNVVGQGQRFVRAGTAIAGSFDQPFYRIRETVNFTATIVNAGLIDLNPTIGMDAPGVGHNSSQGIVLPTGSTQNVFDAFTVPVATSAGTYSLTVTASQNGSESRQFSFVIPPPKMTASLVPGPYNAGGQMAVRITNEGGLDTTTDYLIRLSDENGRILATDSDTGFAIQAGEVLTVSIPVPVGVKSGPYRLLVSGFDSGQGVAYDLLRLPFVNGVAAALDVNTNQFNYSAWETVTATASVAALQGTVSGTLALTVSQAGVGNLEPILVAGPDELVNDNDEIGFLDHEFVDLAMDAAGNVYAVWESYDTADILFAMKPAGSGWTTPERVSDSREFGRSEPRLEIDDSGNLYVIWWDNRDLSSEGTNIYFDMRPAGGSWGVDEKVNDTTGFEYQYYPDLAVDGSGNVYAIWWDDRLGNDAIFFSMRPAGGSWGTNSIVSDPATSIFPLYTSLVSDSSGNLHAAWTDTNLYYDYRPFGGSWGTDEQINDGPASTIDDARVDIVLLPGGEPAVGWTDSRNGNNDIFFSYRDSLGGWQPNELVNDDGGSNHQSWVNLGLDSAGNVYAAWDDDRSANDIYFATRNGTGTWSANTQLNDDSGLEAKGYTALAANDGGDIYVAWTDWRLGGTGTEIFGTQRPSGGSWSANERVSLLNGGSRQQRPALAFDGSGQAVLVWDDWRNQWGGPDIYADTRSLTGTWGTDTQVNDDGSGNPSQSYPAAATAGSGDIFAAWTDYRGGSTNIYSSIRNGSGVWSANEQVNDANGAANNNVALAVGVGDDAYAVWTDQRGGNNDIYFAMRPSGGAWGANERVNDDGGPASQFQPDVGVDASGNAYAIWQDSRNGNNDIYFSYRPAGGSWGPNERVNDDGGTAQQYTPVLTVAPDGTVYAAWADLRNGNYDIYFAKRPSGGTWSMNQRVNDDNGTAAQTAPDIARLGDGTLVLVWLDQRQNDRQVFGALSDGTNWYGNVRLSEGRDGNDDVNTAEPTVAVGPNGEVGIAWQDERNYLLQDIFFSTLNLELRPWAGPWSASQQVNDTVGGDNWQWNPDMVADDLGNRYVIFEDDRNGGREAWFAWQAPDGSWSANERINDSAGYIYDPAIDVDPYGNAFAVWDDLRAGGGNDDIYFSYRPVSGTWSVNEKVNDDAGTADQYLPDIIVDSQGNAHAVWTDYRDGDQDIYYSYRPAGGSWGTNVEISDDPGLGHQSDPNIALDAAGNLYVIWDDTRNGSGFDDWDIYFTYKPVGGSWQPNVRVDGAPVGAESWYPRMVVDEAGNAYATWMDDRKGDFNIYFSYRPVGGSWESDIQLNSDLWLYHQMHPNVVVDEAGNATVAWKDYREGSWHIYAAQRDYNGAWGRNVRVDDGGPTDNYYYHRVGLAAHDSGDVTVMWTDYRNGGGADLFAATMEVGAETAVWNQTYPINTVSGQAVTETVGTLYGRPGKYWLSGALTSDIDQGLAQDQQAFYIYPEGVGLNMTLSDDLASPGQMVTVTGQVTNTALLADDFALRVFVGTQAVLSQSFPLNPGQSQSYSVSFAASESRPVRAGVNGAEALEWLTVAEPSVAASLAAPDIVGSQWFSASLTVTNTGLVPAAVDVAVQSGAIQPLLLEPGQSGIVLHNVAITADTILSATLTGDVNQTVTQSVSFGEGAALTIQAPQAALSGTIDAAYVVTGTGTLPTMVVLSAGLDGSPLAANTFTVLPDQVVSGTLVMMASSGGHLLSGELRSASGLLLDQDSVAFSLADAAETAEAEIDILEVSVAPVSLGRNGSGDAFAPVPAGSGFEVTIEMLNRGQTAPVIASLQVFDAVQQWVISPTASITESYTFSLTMPADIPAGEYNGRVVVGGESETFVVAVAGADVDLSIALDQPVYNPGDLIALTVTMDEMAGGSGIYELATRYLEDEGVYTLTIPANTTVQHTFYFTATQSGRASVSLAYSGAGETAGQRILMIDSLPIQVVDAESKADIIFDQSIYTAGDRINLDVTIREEVANLVVMGPLELLRDEDLLNWYPPTVEGGLPWAVTGTHSLSYTLPTALRTGQYTFALVNGTDIRYYQVDVMGWSVTTLETELDSLRYDRQDSLSAEVEFSNDSGTAVSGLRLRAWVVTPETGQLLEFSPMISRTIDLQPGLNTFTITGSFNSPEVGPHQLMVNLMSPDGAWKVSGAAAQFDVGSAHLVDLQTDHGSYGLSQPGTGRVDVYGYGPTSIVVTDTTGATLLNETVDLNGFYSETFGVNTAVYGNYLLVAEVTDQDGNDSRLLHPYNVPEPRDTIAPVLTITDPVTRTYIAGSAPYLYTITGSVSDNSGAVTLLLNGDPITPTISGAFTATMVLTRGLNAVSAVALDEAGNVTFSPLIPLFLVPDTSVTLSPAAPTVTVNVNSMLFTVVMTTSDDIEHAVYSQLLPTGLVTDVTVIASSGDGQVSNLFLDNNTINWQGAMTPTVDVTLQIWGRPLVTGTITGTARLFWGYGVIEDTPSVTVTVVESSDPTVIEMGLVAATSPDYGQFLPGVFLVLGLLTLLWCRQQFFGAKGRKMEEDRP